MNEMISSHFRLSNSTCLLTEVAAVDTTRSSNATQTPRTTTNWSYTVLGEQLWQYWNVQGSIKNRSSLGGYFINIIFETTIICQPFNFVFDWKLLSICSFVQGPYSRAIYSMFWGIPIFSTIMFINWAQINDKLTFALDVPRFLVCKTLGLL